MGQRRAQCPSIGGAQPQNHLERLALLEAENKSLVATLLAVLAVPRTARERDAIRLAIAAAREDAGPVGAARTVLLQEVSCGALTEDEVTTDALLALLRRASLTAHVDDDGDIYITDGLDFPIWVSVDTEQRLIRFFTFMRRSEHQPPVTATDANHVNATVVLPTFYVRADHKDRLCSHFVLPYVDGVIESHVIAAARRFAGASAYGAQKLDEYAVH